jgi:tetratricopeptide (TPR) repeat protein
MSESPNKFIKFWQELKRRKVFGVVTTYAATAYIIIEVINNLAFPLNLPAWIATLVLTILVIGLPVVIVLSWIFDFTPKGIEKTISLEESESKEIVTKPVKGKLRASYVLNAILIIVVLILSYPKVFKRDTLESLQVKGKISVAVMPFQNRTNDTIWNDWQDWIQDNLITSLSNSEELKVRQTETIKNLIQIKGLNNYSSITSSVASGISKKLEADIFIFGSINKVDTIIRVDAKLINSKSEEIFKSFQLEGSSKKILQAIDSLSIMIRNFLVVSKMEQDAPFRFQNLATTSSPQAYRYFSFGNDAFSKGDMQTSIKYYSKALAIDSNLTFAGIFLSCAYGNLGKQKEGRECCLRLYARRDLMPLQYQLWTNSLYSWFFETPLEQIKSLRLLQQIDDQSPTFYYNIAGSYMLLRQWDKAIIEFEKGIELYHKWGSKPFWAYHYSNLGYAYIKTGQYEKAKKMIKKAEEEFPDFPDLLWIQAIISLAEGDTIAASMDIGEYISTNKDNFVSEADITTGIAQIYSEAGIPDKAEKYYRQALSSDPEKSDKLFNLAKFLVDKDRNINEGIELTEKALELCPDSMPYFKYLYMDNKAWGLYKQGKTKEAFDLLEKNWNSRPCYDPDAYLHLEAAKKAVAGLKNN